jgi:iron complex transport system substrate-binding protein
MKFRLLSLIVLIALVLVGIVPLAAQDTVFPVRVEHKFGTTTIEAPPQRVVAIGFTEQDYLYALGVSPVAVRSWYSDPTIAYLPWAEDEANGATPDILVMPFGNLNFEAILALQPDLISAVTAGLTQEEYDLLSQIAPTVAQSGDYVDFGMPWREIQRSVGLAVGMSEEAEVVIAEVEEMIAEVREQHPEFEGQSIAVAYNYGEARTYGFYTGQDGRGRFFTDLGFVIPEELDEIAGENFYADISLERADLLDQDLLVFLGLAWADGGQESIESDPFIQNLEVAQQGRVVFIPAEYDDALQYSSSLSMAYALESIVPLLADVFPPADTVAAATTECEPGFRLFDHEMLATEAVCIPEDPQRIVTLEPTSFDLMISTGNLPVGAIGYLEVVVGGNFPYLQDAFAEITNLGFPVNIEATLAENPDLIVVSAFEADLYDSLAAIAPTVMYESLPNAQWEENTRFMAQVLGLEAEAEALIAAYEARVEALRATLIDNGMPPEDLEVSVIRIYDAQGSAGLQMQLVNAFSSDMLADVGFARPESQAMDVESAMAAYNSAVAATLSLEQLPLLDGDVLIAWGQGADEEMNAANDAIWTEIQDSPLWGSLNVVQEERTYRTGGYWVGWGFHAAHAVLDDLFTLIAEVDPADVSPNPFLAG